MFLTDAGSRYKEKTIEEIEYLLAVEKNAERKKIKIMLHRQRHN